MGGINLKYGKTLLNIILPDGLDYSIIRPKNLPSMEDPVRSVKSALNQPIESRPLVNVMQGKQNVVILVSDISRPAPSRLLIPPILECAEKAGLAKNKITIVFGLGSHRRHSKPEMISLVSEEVFSAVKCLDHDLKNCVRIGVTSRGTPVEVFNLVAQADLIIATGNIEFHYSAGYTGGYKAILPGVCSKATIESNHGMFFEANANAGCIEGNPVREDIEEAGKMFGECFMINAVLNENKDPVQFVAGDPVAAHRVGAKTVDIMYKRKIEQKADVVIASCGGYPKDINLYQAQKGLEYASHALTENGRLILLAECSEGFGEKTFEDWMLKALSPDEPINWLREKFVLGAHKAAVICKVLTCKDVYLHSSFQKDLVESIFFKYSDDPQHTIEELMSCFKGREKIIVMPYANATLPVI